MKFHLAARTSRAQKLAAPLMLPDSSPVYFSPPPTKNHYLPSCFLRSLRRFLHDSHSFTMNQCLPPCVAFEKITSPLNHPLHGHCSTAREAMMKPESCELVSCVEPVELEINSILQVRRYLGNIRWATSVSWANVATRRVKLKKWVMVIPK